MQLTLEIQTGSAAGRTVSVPPDQEVSVGRYKDASLPIPDDPLVSNLHFAVSCDTQGCRLRDLNSRFGTLVNQVRVAEAILTDGDRIVAGQTTFLVRIAGTQPPSASPEIPQPTAAGTSTSAGRPPTAQPSPERRLLDSPDRMVTQVLARLREAGDPLFALLDAARDPQVLPFLQASGEEYVSLYEGPKGEELARFAPYLVTLRPGHAAVQTIVRQGWGNAWGVFLSAARPAADLRKHFRRFLLVRTSAGKELYFRFYDPRVLRAFLPTCTAAQRTEFFGPIRSFLLEGADPAVLWRWEAGKPESQQVPLETLATVAAG